LRSAMRKCRGGSERGAEKISPLAYHCRNSGPNTPEDRLGSSRGSLLLKSPLSGASALFAD
jgi:hypothetical protein